MGGEGVGLNDLVKVKVLYIHQKIHPTDGSKVVVNIPTYKKVPPPLILAYHEKSFTKRPLAKWDI